MMGTPKGGRRDPALFRHADLRKALLQALSCRSAPCWRSSTRRCRKWHTASISQCLRSPKERRWKHSSENCTVTELRAEGGRRGRPLGHPNACGNSTYLRVRMGSSSTHGCSKLLAPGAPMPCAHSPAPLSPHRSGSRIDEPNGASGSGLARCSRSGPTSPLPMSCLCSLVLRTMPK